MVAVNYSSPYSVVPILIGIAVSLSGFFCGKRSHYIIFSILYCILIFSGFQIEFLINKDILIDYFVCFLPMFFIIDIYSRKSGRSENSSLNSDFTDENIIFYLYIFLLFISVYAFYKLNGNVFMSVLFTLVCIFSYLISQLIVYSANLEKEYFKLYSDSRKEENNLKLMYTDLINSQDEKIENAILSERNRISRDIHDSLGHLTSRGILQIGAMIVTEKDENRKKQLSELKNTLSDGMNEVRQSLHNFQNESIDLEGELKNIVDAFDFCKVNFSFSVGSNLNLKQKYSVIYIVKESLTNIAKHSNADRADINIVEIGSKIYIKIFDNGTDIKNNESGMGVFSIKKRVEELNGNIEISTENGYRMFIAFDA